jgi:predicted RNase H-like nuclease (RuvC/YqgF family)
MAGRKATPEGSQLTDVKVQIARVEERLVSMGMHQEKMGEEISKISTKLDNHQVVTQDYKNQVDGFKTEYKTDKKWANGIFGTLFAGLLAWIEYRHRN